MNNATTNINSSGGNTSIVGSAIGAGNSVAGNTFTISDSLNIGSTPQPSELLSALHKLRSELDKATDLPEDQADDLKTCLDAAIKAVNRSEPNKDRTIEKLTTMQKLLDGLKDTFKSALGLGILVGEVLLAAKGLQF